MDTASITRVHQVCLGSFEEISLVVKKNDSNFSN